MSAIMTFVFVLLVRKTLDRKTKKKIDSNDLHAGTGGSTEWYIQQGRVYTLESEDDAVVESDMMLRGRRMPAPGNGFGMHLVNVRPPPKKTTSFHITKPEHRYPIISRRAVSP